MDNDSSAFPTLLDGKADREGKGKRAELPEMLAQRYKFYVCHRGQSLSEQDYIVLWNDESQRYLSYLTPQQRSLHNEQLLQAIDKIDMVATQNSMEKALMQQRLNAKKSNHAGHELGAREFTLTYSPKWFGDEEARDTMKKAILKLIKYYSDDIIQMRAVGEVGSNGLSHVHCFYKLRGGLKISDKNFKRAYKHWNPKKVTSRTGHEGGHHANVRVESDFQGYIDKDVDTAWLDLYYPEVDPTA